MPLKPYLLCLILFYLQLTLIESAPRFTSVVTQHSNTNNSVSIATVSNESVSEVILLNDSVSERSGLHLEDLNKNDTKLNISKHNFDNVDSPNGSISSHRKNYASDSNTYSHNDNVTDVHVVDIVKHEISTLGADHPKKDDNSSQNINFQNIYGRIVNKTIHMLLDGTTSNKISGSKRIVAADDFHRNKTELFNNITWSGDSTLSAGTNQTNSTGTGNSSLSLEFPTLSFIKRPPKLYLAHTRNTAIFECIPYVINKTYDVSLKWVLPRNVPIISKEKIHSSEYSGAFITPNNSILILSNMAEKFSGIYKCVIESSDGSRIEAKMTLKVTLYMDSVRRWLIIGFCGGGTCVVITIIFILSCKIENDRKKFYAERRRVKQQVLVSHRQ